MPKNAFSIILVLIPIINLKICQALKTFLSLATEGFAPRFLACPICLKAVVSS